jgi:hypothetical protein
LKSFMPAIRFSSVGAMGFGTWGACRATDALSALFASALSHPEGDVFARMGSNPSRATDRIAIGKVKTPVKNPRRNLAIALLLHHP